MVCSEDRHWILSSTPFLWIMVMIRLNSTKELICTRVLPFKLNSFVEYHYFVLSTDFAVDIPHQRSNKSIAFGVEKRANIMRYQIVQFRKSYQSVSFCICLYPQKVYDTRRFLIVQFSYIVLLLLIL